MNDAKQIPCSCNTCPGASCPCGCQQPSVQPTAQTACACGARCQCGPGCTCAKS